LLKPGGGLVCSTPNEDKWNYKKSKHPFHVRHYKHNEISELLKEAGFIDIVFYTQMSDNDRVVKPGKSGRFLIVHAKKPQY